MSWANGWLWIIAALVLAAVEVLAPAADPASDWAWRTALQRERPRT